MAKFHEKAILVYGKKQTVEGTQVTPANTDVIAALNLNYEDVYEKDETQFAGDELSRDAFITVKDHYAQCDFEVLMPYIGTMPGSGTLPSTDVPFSEWFQCCGGAVTIGAGVASAASCTISNATASASLMTLDIRKASQDVGTQKKFVIYDARGTVDLNIETGSRATLKFNFMGNFVAPAQVAAFVASFGAQKSDIASVVRKSTIISVEIVDWNNGSPTFPGTSNLCFSKLSASNIFGFDYSRFLTGCQEGFSKGAVPTDIVVTVLEDAADATGFKPETEVGNFKAVRIKYSDTGSASPGKNVQIDFSKVQVSDLKPSKVGTYFGTDVTLRNVGNTTLTFS